MFLLGLSAPELLEILMGILTLSAPLAKLTSSVGGATTGASRLTSGQKILAAFALVVLSFAVLTAHMYWPSIIDKKDTLIYGAWLFLSMVAGMFAQVMVSNHQGGRSLLSVSAEQLMLPLLFSVTGFYAIWVVTNAPNANKSPIFAIYTAFLNGYFWRTMGNPKAPSKREDD